MTLMTEQSGVAPRKISNTGHLGLSRNGSVERIPENVTQIDFLGGVMAFLI